MDANVFISARSARVLPVPGGPCTCTQPSVSPIDINREQQALTCMRASCMAALYKYSLARASVC